MTPTAHAPLARFLSPQVARLINERGMRTALRGACVDITVVCCDLRGFTRYTEAHPTEYSLQLLRDYYKVVGQAAAQFNATLKDFVGDGAMILVGAPLPVREHVDIALSLANVLRSDVERMLRRWSRRQQNLSVGIGVASGPVHAGVVASDSRYEYVAVGPAVNIASRLCENAAGRQILVSPETAARAGAWRGRLVAGPVLSMKGVEGTMGALMLCARAADAA